MYVYNELGLVPPVELEQAVIEPEHEEPSWMDDPLAGPTPMVQAKI